MGLLQEREQIRQAMEDQPVIDMACGVLMVSFACEPQEARDLLAAVASRADVHVWEVAEAVTSTTRGKPMPELLHEHLTAALQARQTDRT
ncbi:hypothetical protein AQJ23_40715 [Streptomyces antibioticus]|nr:ANTAR domain-containing protein [Streptomyces antibioticus]KUN17765.1 hypothetical protein AQJ23_40715 [Streptomyces antibioticus]